MADNGQPRAIRFYYQGHVPSKTNLRMSGSDSARAKRNAVRQYQRDIGDLANMAKARARREGVRGLDLVGWRKVELIGYDQSADPDNWFKATLDALEGICYENDAQVRRGAWESRTSEESHGRHGLHVEVTWL